MKLHIPNILRGRRNVGNRPPSRRSSQETNSLSNTASLPFAQAEGHVMATQYFHLRALKCAWRPFADKSLSHWTTTIVIALALTIYGTFSLLLVNANTALNKWEENNLVTVFMQRSVDRDQLVQIGRTIKGYSGVSDLVIIPPKDAITRLKGMMGEEAALLDELEENPLPFSMEFKMVGQDRAQYTAFAKKIGALAGVESVSYDHQWADRLTALVRAIRYIGNILSFLLLAAVALIVSNTIKLTIIARRDEMEIMRFMGADDAFIKTPFVYEGLLQGLLGAAIALLLTGLLYFGARDAIAELGRSLGTMLQLEFLPFSQLGLLVVLGATLGLSGAFISLSRFLDV
ncbi:MAG: ABC transporter permease [Magnetococcales bacterium]|nr:ABC transporter permease [Magnetococcales bacterium]MBF0437972.1 ABC transporter permease [Magnetococcales bacterium]